MPILPPAAPPLPGMHAPPPCTARALALGLDGGDGDYDGMSHAGARIVLRNRGRAACAIPGLARITFRDARGPLPIARRAPMGMHPGPVILPVTIPPGGAAATVLRWVSGEVYDRSRCLMPTRIVVTLGRGGLAGRFRGRLCGPAGQDAGFDQPPFAVTGPAP